MLNKKRAKVMLIAVNLLLISLVVFGNAFSSSAYLGQQSQTPIQRKVRLLRQSLPPGGGAECPIQMKVILDSEEKLLEGPYTDLLVKSEDWPKQMEVEIKNVSQKVINHIEILFVVPYLNNGGTRFDADQAEAVAGRVLWYGAKTRIPRAKATKAFYPGETITAKLQPEEYDAQAAALRKQSIARINEAEIMVVEIDFEDKSYWMFGILHPPQ